MDIKLTLKAARINAGVSLETAAKAISRSVSAIRRYERQTSVPSVVDAQILADLYKIPVSNLTFVRKSN